MQSVSTSLSKRAGAPVYIKPASSKKFIPVSKTLAALTILIAVLMPAQLAVADYLGTAAIRIFIDPATLEVGGALNNGFDVNDVFLVVGEITPGDTGSDSGHADWNTVYPVPGMEIVGTAILDRKPDGTYSTVDAKDTDAT